MKPGEKLYPLQGDPMFKRISQQLQEEHRAKEERLRQSQVNVDRTRNQIAEEEEALAFAAGISREEYEELMERGSFGVEILQALIKGQAKSVDEAIHFLYQQAGDKAGAFADWLKRISAEKKYHPFQPETAWEQLNREMDEHDHPRPKRKRKGPTKKGIYNRFRRWQEEQDLHQEQDQAFDDFINKWQKSQKQKTGA